MSCLLVLTLAGPVASQTPQIQAATAAPSSGPASRPVGAADLYYEVIEVQPKVRIAPLGTDPITGKQWRYAKVGDRLRAGQQISTSWRSKVKLVARPASPPTVILIENMTLMGISELAQLANTSKSRLDLRYGAVRAGVAEGELRSDMEIRCPVATLSKRGTDIFRFEYMNGRFRMSLSEQGRGMLRALQLQYGTRGTLLRTRSRLLTAGQFVTQRMAMAVDGVQFDRDININDLFGLQGNDRLFTLLNNHGLGFLLPQGNNVLNLLGSPKEGGIQQGGDGMNALTADSFNQPLGRLVREARDAVFGVGQGVVPNVFVGQSRRRLRDLQDRCKGLSPGQCKRQQLQRLAGRR